MQYQLYIFVSVAVLWLLGVSLALYKIHALFNRLTKGVSDEDFRKVLGKILSKQEASESRISELFKKIAYIEEADKLHIQKVGLVRFNPFRELGGDHSFSLAVLDAENTGIIITSLHTRDRTRVYMKDVKKGKSRFDLSVEEKKALENAEKRR